MVMCEIFGTRERTFKGIEKEKCSSLNPDSKSGNLPKSVQSGRRKTKTKKTYLSTSLSPANWQKI